MVDSNGVELDLTNPFIARKLERIRAEKLVDHTFMRKLLSKKISIMEVLFLFLISAFVISLIRYLLSLIDSEST
jgi:hypothetical protein